jgi:hypothetical protein
MARQAMMRRCERRGRAISLAIAPLRPEIGVRSFFDTASSAAPAWGDFIADTITNFRAFGI